MPILYHPTASYQFYVAPGSSSVNITAAIYNVGGVTLDVETKTQSPSPPLTLNTLVEGSTTPDVWTAFDYEDVGNTADNPQTYARYPARFLTPIINEFEGSEEIRVITHPYGGALTGGTELNGVDKVEFYLNGGPGVTGIKNTDPVTGQQNIWSVKMPSGLSAEMVEVRAKVFPKVGKTNVLQGTGYKTTQEAIALYGDRRDDTPPYNSSPYKQGIYPNRRGCLIENGLTTYYVSPSGNDSNTGLSSGQAKLTPEAVYTAASDGKVKIINEYGKADALHVSRYVRQDASQTETDHIPVVEGGVIIWNNGNTTNNNNSVGCIFKNVDFRPDVNERSETMRIRSVGSARYVFIGCDFGPDAKADSHGGQFGELEDQANSGSLPGLRVELTITGVYQSPTFFHNCDFRHSTCSTSREVVDTVFVLPPTQNDVCNAQLLYNVQCKDVAAIIYPYGSAAYGITSFVPKGSARSYTAIASKAGITHDEQAIRALMDPFYESLGTSAGVSGSPYAGVTVDNNADWTVLDPSQDMKDKYEDIPNLGFWPDWTLALRKANRPWSRTDINLGYFTGITSATNPTPYAGGTAHRGFVANGGTPTARDPHVDITQTFYESDFGGTAEDGGVWNSIIANLDVTGHLNDYQGIFFADASRVDESGFWDINLQIDTTVGGASMFTAGGDYLNKQQFVHFGPNIGNDIGDFKTRWMGEGPLAYSPYAPTPQRNLFFYETDGWVFPNISDDPSGVQKSVYDWVTAPTSKLTPMGISFDDDGSYNSWLVTDNPYNIWREPVFTAFQYGGTLDGSIDGGGIRYITPGACGDLTGPLGAFGSYANNQSTLNYGLMGWASNLYRFGITGQNSSGILTDPQSGQTFQSDPAWSGSGKRSTDQLKQVTYWLSSIGWRAIAGLTYNVGSTYEKYFEFTIADYSAEGITWGAGIFSSLQSAYMQMSASDIRREIRDQVDNGFPQNYNVEGGQTFTYEGVPMQMTYMFEKRYR